MRMIVKKRRKKKIFVILLFAFILNIIFSIGFIKYYSDKAAPIIINYSETEIKRLIFLVINNSIGEATDNLNVNDIFSIQYNSSGEIVLIDFDSKKASVILTGITSLIEYNLKEIENGNVDSLIRYYNSDSLDLLRKGIILEIPFGIVFNSNYLNNIGPKIPVRVVFMKNLETGFSTDVSEYGINNALLKLNVNIKVSVKIILPIVSDNIETDFSIPIAIKIIQGKIPSYYMDGFTTNSNIVKEG